MQKPDISFQGETADTWRKYLQKTKNKPKNKKNKLKKQTLNQIAKK